MLKQVKMLNLVEYVFKPIGLCGRNYNLWIDHE